MRRNKRRNALTLGTLVLSCGAALAAQESDSEAPPLLVLEAGPEVKVRNDADVVLGTIRDHVVEPADGRVSHVIVETALRSALVPLEGFSWRDPGHRPVLAMTAVHLAELPGFDAETFRREALAREAAGADAGSVEAGEAGASPRARRLLASRILASPVLAVDTPYGAVERLVLDLRDQRIAFALLSTPERDGLVAVPWTALTYTAPKRADEEPRLLLARTRDEMADAPRIAPDELRRLGGTELLERIRGFYRATTASPSDRTVQDA